MWFLYCLVFCYPQSCQYLIVAMELLCTQATNWSPCWNGPETQQMVQGLGWTASRLQGKSHWSVVGWERDPAGSGGIDHLGCIFSDLCTHIWKQEASSAVLLVQDIDSTADKLGGFFFFQVFPVSHLENSEQPEGKGNTWRDSGVIWAEQTLVWQATEKSNMCSEAGEERHRDPVEGSRV